MKIVYIEDVVLQYLQYRLLLVSKANPGGLGLSFIDKYMTVNRKNFPYLLELDNIIDLCQIKDFNYSEFNDIKSEVQLNINDLLNKNVANITLKYV